MDKKRSPKSSIAAKSSLTMAWPATLRPMIVGQPDHRVRSSLQLVANLLQLQATSAALTRPEEALSDAAARIKALAHWHAFLSQTPTNGRRTVALDGYLHALADNIVDAAAADSRIVLLVNADPLKVPARVAGMLGQIVNELVMNAVRRAFGAKRSGTIQVECGMDAGGKIALQVSDETEGYVNGTGARAPVTFDLQIVTGLVKQLGGTFIASKPGARLLHRVTIPISGRASSAGRKRPAARQQSN